VNPEAAYPIHDMLLRPLPVREGPWGRHWPLPDWDGPWLRRYGEAEVIRIGPGGALPDRLRRVADEVWALLEGEIELTAVDLRPDSPTHDAELRLDLTEPTLILIPFGVGLRVRSVGRGAWVSRMATHTEVEDPVTASDIGRG
jgi:hypothetical protein